jgi:hypothetical protein
VSIPSMCHAANYSLGWGNGRGHMAYAWMVWWFLVSTLAGARLPFDAQYFCMHGESALAYSGKQLFSY